MKSETEQEKFWMSEFGNNYINRNQISKLLPAKINLFSNILKYTEGVSSFLELGSNIGTNLLALNQLKPNASLNALEINKISKDRLYDTFLTNLIINSGAAPSMQDSGIMEILSQIKNSKSTGRVIAEFDLDIISNDSSKDTILEDGDRIYIPQLTQQVFIQGEVSNSGAIRYASGQDIDYYINKSGGALLTADINNIFIVHPNGETQRIDMGRKNIFQSSPSSREMQLYPGSVIFIPRGIDNSATTRLAAQAYVSILGNIGIALASLSSINNN